MKRRTRLAAMLWLVLAAGCKNDSQDLPPDAGVVRAMHGIAELGVLTMNLDSNPLGDFDYAGIRGLNRPGAGNHEVSFDVRLPGGEPSTTLATMNVATGIDRAHTIVLTGTADQPEILTWQQPARNWAEEAAESNTAITVLEVSFGHAALSRGPLDFYVGTSPVDPATSTPIASLGHSDVSAIVEIDADVLEILVTPAGDPATVLYDSNGLALPTATSVLFVAYDGAKLDGDTPWLELRSLGEAFSNAIPNRKVPASARAVHSARGVGSQDVIVRSSGDTLAGGIVFGDVSAYVTAPTGTNTLDVKPTGDPDEVTATASLVAAAGSDSTLLLSGDADGASAVVIGDDVRRISTAAKFRVINGAQDVLTLDFYLVEPGTSIEDVGPTFAVVTYPFGSGYVGFTAGNYDLVVAQTGSKDVLAGPMRVTLRNSGLYGVVAAEAAQNGQLEFILLDDLAD